MAIAPVDIHQSRGLFDLIQRSLVPLRPVSQRTFVFRLPRDRDGCADLGPSQGSRYMVQDLHFAVPGVMHSLGGLKKTCAAGSARTVLHAKIASASTNFSPGRDALFE